MRVHGTPTAHGTHQPASAPRWAVTLATHVLPPGPPRSRYRQEFLAELHYIDTADQLRYSIGILSRSWALRRALTEEGPMSHDTLPRTPLTCRLNVHHQYRTTTTEDGARYRRCRRCGKDHPSTGGGPRDWAALGPVG